MTRTLAPSVDIQRGHDPVVPPTDIHVIIDVIRAFTTAQILFERGASVLLLADSVERAHELRDEHPDALLAGERNARKLPEFDLGNSPWEAGHSEVEGRPVVLTTTHGVTAALSASEGSRVLVTGYANARPTATLLRDALVTGRARHITLVASNPGGDEDLACAEWIRALALGRPEDDEREDDALTPETVERRIRSSDAAQKFLDSDRPEFDARDIDLCATRRDADFIMELFFPHNRPPTLRAITLETETAEIP
jgi:2-phosphosulfolactate phosphatase